MTTTTHRTRRVLRLGAAMLAAGALLLSGCSGPGPDDPVIGLITKQENNPYWVTMRQIAEQTARDERVTLIAATGTSDVDVAAQEAALRDMIDRKVDGILIAPNDSTALNPLIAEARQAGIVVIAVDTPVEPSDAVDAYFATDNTEAGRLVGAYAAAKAKQLGLTPKVAMLNLAPGVSSGEQRHEGFLEGFGLTADSPELVAQADSQGDRKLGETEMASILSAHPDVNVIYTVNEPAALGALTALKAANADLARIVLVSVDGGCEAIKSVVRSGEIDATAQQFPENMAREGVRALAWAARGGEKPSGFLNTGVELISDSPAPDVASRDVAFGVRNCWG